MRKFLKEYSLQVKIALGLLFILMIAFALLKPAQVRKQGNTLLDPSEPGIGTMTKNETYDFLVDSLSSDNNVVTYINGKMWVPWYSSSSSCTLGDLKKNDACDASIDISHNCMVTDEFSQVGILVSMGKNQSRMDSFFATVKAINSSYGNLPSWRVYRNSDVIESCKDRINGNCDTASDATSRIIIALYTGSRNPGFSDESRKAYEAYADMLVSSFLTYETDHTCRKSSIGEGDICWWLSSGSVAKILGPETSDYSYTGYYGDAIIAMLEACSITGDKTYCQVAEDFSRNYLQAAKFDGANFSVPPGRSFRWTNLNGTPLAVCTNTCNPVQWDDADAPRALGICLANYYADRIGYRLDALSRYCAIWETDHMNSTSSIPLQYTPDGQASAPSQSGYFAQGLESLFLAGSGEKAKYKIALNNSLSHFQVSTKTWDAHSCFGVYMPAFPIRSLGIGLGRDSGVFEKDK